MKNYIKTQIFNDWIAYKGSQMNVLKINPNSFKNVSQWDTQGENGTETIILDASTAHQTRINDAISDKVQNEKMQEKIRIQNVFISK